ncbi:HD domain-containing protein [Megasphaera elsdenii]|uniref:HD domain-containing protein n=1 Tax=Megasphaera elsdenii TaxID=907 RepID=UPI003C6D2305
MFILSLGEKKEQSGQFFWLPLTLHLKDTMEVMEFLWHHWVSEGQKEIISRTLSDTGEVAIDIACRSACFFGRNS